ncbi:MAG: DUF1987 domain-containing protein [Bacteroidota bacterium]
MDALNIKGTGETPTIIFDKEANKFEITGKSLPEDVKEFYNPVLRWLKTYAENPNPKTVVKIKMEYFNTASSKMILELFEVLNDMYSAGKDVEIEWHYMEDDEDMHDAGNDYADMLDLPFKMISYQHIAK